MGVVEDIHFIADQFLHKVRKSGPENIMALCPFHVKTDGTEEKRPSFAMSLTSGLWFCHSCQSSGNLYTFLRDIGLTSHQIEFKFRMTIDAAARNSPPPMNPLDVPVISNNPIEEGLLGIFDACPLGLVRDGFSEETLRHFGIGFDEHHMRVTYPLRDLAGKLVGVSGRSMNDYWPKYKIYDKEYVTWGLPARIGWDKRTCLWNANEVYPQLLFQNNPSYIVVVEGFKACMWLWQCGIKNVVALIGTYLSPEHKWILERLGAPVYLFLDNNDPGQMGTMKAIGKLRQSLQVRVINYPERLIDEEDAQPDSLTKEEVVQQWHGAVSYCTQLDT
jgi:DNA primase